MLIKEKEIEALKNELTDQQVWLGKAYFNSGFVTINEISLSWNGQTIDIIGFVRDNKKRSNRVALEIDIEEK